MNKKLFILLALVLSLGSSCGAGKKIVAQETTIHTAPNETQRRDIKSIETVKENNTKSSLTVKIAETQKKRKLLKIKLLQKLLITFLGMLYFKNMFLVQEMLITKGLRKIKML